MVEYLSCITPACVDSLGVGSGGYVMVHSACLQPRSYFRRDQVLVISKWKIVSESLVALSDKCTGVIVADLFL